MESAIRDVLWDSEKSVGSAWGGVRVSVYSRSAPNAVGDSRQPRALVSVLLNARARQKRLQMSMRKPLKLLTYSRA